MGTYSESTVNDPGHKGDGIKNATFGDELATVFRDRFFCRPDAYALFLPTSATPFKVDEPVTLDVITAHLTGARRIGAYSTAPGDSCVWGCFDIDHTGHKKKLSYDEAQSLYDLGLAIIAKARELGLSAYLERSKRGGWHVWLFAQSPISAALMRRVLRALLAACGFPIPANASKTGPQDAIELFPMQDTIGSGYGNPVFLPYFGGDPLGMTVFVEPDHPELKAVPVVDFLAQVQPVPPATLAEVGEMARAPHPHTNGHASTPPHTDEDAATVLARLSSRCQQFKDALAVQENGGLEEPDWFQWIHTLTTAGYAEAAHTFSQLSHKHDKRSASRLATCENAYTAGTAKPPIRCTTIGCDEEQITACFSGVVFRKEDGISNNPMVHVREEYSETPAEPNGGAPPDPDWTTFEDDGREPEESSEQAPHRTTIQVNNRELWAISEKAQQALLVQNTPPFLFVRGGQLARVITDEEERALIETVGEAALRGYLTRSAEFVRVRAKGKTEGKPAFFQTRVSPPKDVVQDILSLPEKPFPPLLGVVGCPVLRPDGSILSTAGYDGATRLFYHASAGLQVPAIADHPSQADATAACDFVQKELLPDFPFEEIADKTNFLACLLSAIVRPAIRGHVPLALLDKPAPGSGASLLTDLVAMIVSGDHAAKLSAPEGRDAETEWTKKITALLLTGSPICVIDNIENDALESAALSRLITAGIWQERLLGGNAIPALRVRCILIATGNNLALRGDLARRSYRIRLDPQVEKPWERVNFKKEDLLDWTKKQRGTLLAHLLTMARAWFVAGQPQPTERPMKLGGFEDWTRIVGGILSFAGREGFLSNQQVLYDLVDEAGPQWGSFLSAWCEQFGDRWITIKYFADSVLGLSANAPLVESLPDEVGWDREKLESSRIRLGKALRKQAFRVYGGYKLERGGKDKHTKGTQWRVRKL